MTPWEENLRESMQRFIRQFRQTCTRAGRNAPEITILFASKYLNEEQFCSWLSIIPLVQCSNVAIGENRVQDAKEKFSSAQERQPDIFRRLPKILIGNLQKNKINKAIELFDEFHALDGSELANALEARLAKIGKIMPVFLEVNVSGEETKRGIPFRKNKRNARDEEPFEKLDRMVEEIKKLAHLRLQGLMTMAPMSKDPEVSRPFFRTLRQQADRNQLKTSMGMSSDWQVAIEEGTDVIRVGSAVFGKTNQSA